ncbi:MAG: LLM class flavin-dependent oxidoreductase [Candidatus Bathyarchaeia archaeon]
MGKMEISVNLGENDYDPQAFVDAAVYADKLGFRTVWFGDHIFPWYHSGKRSSFAWSMMSVALEKTNRIKVGPWVTVPTGARYHPAIIAQAAATLDNMYPGRVQLGVGTGEALNERPFWNGNWPKWEERMERLTEGTRLIRQMWESAEPFKFEGKYFSSDFYFLYTKPRKKIPIYSSAIGRRAAHAAGLNADGLITISPRNDPQKLKEIILPEYQKGRNEANKTGLGKVAVELVFSFDKPEDIIKKAWKTIGICRKDSWSLPTPVAVEEAGKQVTVNDLKRNMHFCRNWKDVVSVIETYQEVGVNEVTTYTGCDKKQIRAFAKNILSVF